MLLSKVTYSAFRLFSFFVSKCVPWESNAILYLSRNDSGRQGEMVSRDLLIILKDDDQELEPGVLLTRSDDLLRRGVCLSSVR